MAAPAYIISRVADPIFAVFIGVSAAAMRINREEKAKGYTPQQTIDNGLRYAWHGSRRVDLSSDADTFDLFFAGASVRFSGVRLEEKSSFPLSPV
ncbi:hypothetical protein E4U16_007557 [Claviceps sp. LM84 group G4]|nr:hypothetical protein E4U16_007557 [Claviceps sp. LM84 group G4]